MKKFIKKHYAVLTGLLVFLVYLTTIAPSVVEIDSGELSTVQTTLGIAHPTGYPLFTMLGYLFSLIPFGFSKIYQLNLLTAVWCSFGIMVFVYTAKTVLDNIEIFQPKKILPAAKNKLSNKKQKATDKKETKTASFIPEDKKYLAAVFGGLILAFDKTYWMQGTSVEVYSLQLFLINLVILFLVKAYIAKDDLQKIRFFNMWLAFAFVLALGFSNHMTTLFILPGAAYLFFNKYGFNKKSFIRITLMIALFIPALVLIYSYMPIRAAQNPVMDWGNPTTLAKIFRHISGEQYQVWLFSSFKSAEKQFTYFVSNLPGEFLISLFISIIGIFTSFFAARKFFVFLLITFLFTIGYAINYDIHDIDSYFLLAYVALGFFAVFGSVQLLSTLKLKRHPYFIPALLIIVFIMVELYFNYGEVNQSDVYTFQDYTKAVLGGVDKRAIVFSYEWDYLVSPSCYFQFVENYRRDVAVVDKELLRRSWYYHQLNTVHPNLLSGMQGDVQQFLQALAPFESKEKFDPNLLENLYRKLMTDLVATNIDKRDFYVAPELFENEMQRGEFSLPAGYMLAPDLLLFKVVKGNAYLPAADPDFKIRFPSVGNTYTNFIQNLVGTMLARRALYEMQFDRIDRAKIYIRKIKSDLPNYILPKGLAEVLER
ncbi:MAG: protein O-mannosyl-transferase family [Ignavibacteriaceae bacterium]